VVSGSRFRPAWWLPGPHAQTLFASLFGRSVPLRAWRERLELPDGDFIDIDHVGESGPVVLLLHGLEGSSRSHYIRIVTQRLSATGLRAYVMHFRGCSGTPNRLARGYHSGETGDLETVLDVLSRRGRDETPAAAVGFSLGGNVLLKYLGERGGDTVLRSAVAVSVPFRLDRCADRIDQGYSRFYQWLLLRSIKRSLARKADILRERIDLQALSDSHSFWELDDRITAPLHGFRDVNDYYQRSSSRQYLKGIRVPTLILQARDDPLIPPDAIPSPDELSASVELELSDHGGHVGFVAGQVPFRPRYWLAERIVDYVAEHL
jgi:predicted alpha/beta-fold hydrolase